MNTTDPTGGVTAEDIEAACAPRSDQLNNIDLETAPRTVTIVALRKFRAEQPIGLVTDFYGEARPWKPCKTTFRAMRRVWGTNPRSWIGKSLTLYRDADVTFGKVAVGGIRISHMSGLDRPRIMTLPASQGKFQQVEVKPLTDANRATPAGPEMITEAQKLQIKREMDRTGLDKETVLDEACSITGRDLRTANDLTHDETVKLIAALADTPDRFPVDANAEAIQ